ncbi:MAG: hypothetical protein CL949_19785 [Erythrobacter sp.]|nr:hypothetical protein [Erythrobacter sp.]|tara:strand:+ start:747 stop:1040 length:294 start_codon:yes stop_codon:yes gene_type:complete
MSDEWKVGDLAVCIDDRWCACGRPTCGMKAIAPRKEQLLRVNAVHSFVDRQFLRFEEGPDDHFWHATAFRKVQPDTDAADDALWVEQLQHLRRRVPA